MTVPSKSPAVSPAIFGWLALLLLFAAPASVESGRLLGRALSIESQSIHLTTAFRKFSGAQQMATTARSAALWRSPYRTGSLHLATTIGQLVHGARDDGLISVGPVLAYRRMTRLRTVVLEAGSAVSWIDGDGFAEQALSQRLQFLSHVVAGIALLPGDSAELLLRLQHISNAGQDEHNPGLDSAGLELRLRFGA